MSKTAKILLIVAACVVLIYVGSGVLLAATVVRSGMVSVSVDQPDMDLDISVPAALVHAGLAALPLVQDEVMAEMRSELGDMAPAAAAALRAIEDAPDAVLVDIEDHGERVQVIKRGSSLEVHVESPDGDVDVTLPAGLLGAIARAIS